MLTLLIALLLAASPQDQSIPVSFTNGNVKLAGTVYLPPGKGPFPAVVLFHSANGPLRDFHAYRHLTTALPAAGIAVLLYDRRGSGESTGNFVTATFEDLARDGIAGVAYLKSRGDIDQRHIGAWGISQGGWTAPLAATLSPDIAFIVAVSAPGVTPARQMDYSAENRLAATGRSPAIIERAIAARHALNGYYRGKSSREAAERAVSQIRDEPWFADVYLPNGGSLPDDPTRTQWYSQMDYDPLQVLSRVRVPAAFFFADHDNWVPVDESIANIRRATSSNRNVMIQRVAETDHLMETGAPDSAGPTSARYVEALVRWSHRTVSARFTPH